LAIRGAESVSKRPSFGCSSSANAPIARACGHAITSSRVATGAQISLCWSSTRAQCAKSCFAKRSPIAAESSRDAAVRLAALS
jgi:hypothetical protein